MDFLPPNSCGFLSSLALVLALILPTHAASPTSASPGGASNVWSLQPVILPAVPLPASIPLQARIRNPIDAFIFSRLETAGLQPSPEADRRTLIRRLCFDLIGLPPDPAEVERFEADPDPMAYERLVDRLLASPHHGERWARHWLDVARYGETHGYDKDQPRPNAWPYRDYVIRSLNSDKPYSRFVQEQIAGDHLWPDTLDGITALGFIAAGPWDLIGHAEVPETKIDGQIARLLDRDDMMSNVLNTFCSVTVQCARCHDHKFDPISMVDYYRLTAVFSALDRADRKFDPDPEIASQRRALETRKAPLARQAAELDRILTDRGGPALALLQRLIPSIKAGKVPGDQPENGWHSAIANSPDTTKWVQVDLGDPVEIRSVITAPCHDDFAGIGAGFGFPQRFRIEVSDHPEFTDGAQVLLDHTGADHPRPDTTPIVTTVPPGIRARYIRWTATRLASRSSDWIFALAEVEVRDANQVNRALGRPVASTDSIEAAPRWRRSNLTDGWYPGLRKLSADALANQLQRDHQQLVERMPADETSRERERIGSELESIQRDIATLPKQQVVYAATIHHGSGAFRGTGPDGGRPRPVHVLARGDVRKPGATVQPGTLRFLDATGDLDLPEDHPESARRAALARWVIDPGNPLTWRSIVNRVWQYHFGRALSDSPNDFGRMGQPPSHPELMDWLAATFRDGDQSLKGLHRLLVTSSTYRQVSHHRADAAAVDSDNRLLWRSQRRKLEAEAVRDSLLSVAGRLDPTLGGPSFQDFKIERPEHSPHYEYHLADPDDPRTHRRSIYRFLVRSQPQPFMATLDCADPSMSVDRRNETLNSLQALAFLNNRLVVTLSRHFASRVESLSSDPAIQVRHAFRLALSRNPAPAELDALVAYRKEHGLNNTCRLLFNLNEFTFID
jgi:hypothetical protein